MEFINKLISLKKQADLWSIECDGKLHCGHSDRVYLLLSFYQDYYKSNKTNIDLNSIFYYLSPYCLSSFMDDYSHIYKCCHLNSINNIECNPEICNSIKSHYRNRNNTNKTINNDIYKIKKNKKNYIKEISTIMTFDKVHTFLCHYNIFGKKNNNTNDNNEKKQDDNDTDKIKTDLIFRTKNVNSNKFLTDFNKINDNNNNGYINYCFGNEFSYPYLRPLYPSYYFELLNNDIHQIEDDDFKIELNNAKNIRKNGYIQVLKADRGYPYYGVSSGDSFPVSSLLSILFYTNWDELCQKFRLSFYQKQKPKKAGYYNKKGEECDEDDYGAEWYSGDSIPFYFFGLFLFIGIEFYGTKGSINDSLTFYHGLSCKMTFDTLSTLFSSPTSVTPNERIAKQFATENGIILILKAQFKGPHNNTKYLDVSEISDHTGEEERIYFGRYNCLLISDIISQPNNKELGKYESVNFEKYLKPFNWFVKVTRGYCYGYHGKYYNLCGLKEMNERKILYGLLCNYLKIEKYDIPKYINTLFKHYCITKKGCKCDMDFGDDTDSKPLSYIIKDKW